MNGLTPPDERYTEVYTRRYTDLKDLSEIARENAVTDGTKSFLRRLPRTQHISTTEMSNQHLR